MISSEHQTFLKLYEPVHDRFERFCRARAYGEMNYEDLINDTLLVAYEKMGTLKSEKAFLSFLFSISVRLLANNHKKMKPELGVEHDSFSDQMATGSDENPEQTAEVHLLHNALAHVSIDQREAIILFEISGFAVREIAEIQKYQ